jgi:hypothetical protein
MRSASCRSTLNVKATSLGDGAAIYRIEDCGVLKGFLANPRLNGGDIVLPTQIVEPIPSISFPAHPAAQGAYKLDHDYYSQA